MKAAVSGLLCLAVSCSGMANSMDNDTCYLVNEDNYQKFMDKAHDIKIKNPFNPDECVLMNYGRKYQADVDADYFNGNENILGMYEKFQRTRQTRVEMVFDNKSGTLYSFMQFDTRDKSMKDFKREITDPTLEMLFDEYIFLHELMHLEEKVTRSPTYDMSQKESYADIASVIMLGSEHDMDVSQIYRLLEKVKNVRLADDMKFRMHHRKKEGNHSHYHLDSFDNALAYLEHLQTNDISLRVTSIQEASALATYMMRNGNTSNSLIDFENKIASMQNDPNRNLFYELPHSQQLVVYKYYKGEIVSRLQNWFEAPEDMLPIEKEKLLAVSPVVIEEALRHFPKISLDNARTYLDSDFMTVPSMTTVSISIEPTENNYIDKPLSLRVP